tara:strand:+ start:2033 stop:2182 length:150 start_codon:yes stop_codon:yes gene_type:complete
MLIQAITYIGAGIGFFVLMSALGLVMAALFTRSLPSKAKWDAAKVQVSA